MGRDGDGCRSVDTSVLYSSLMVRSSSSATSMYTRPRDMCFGLGFRLKPQPDHPRPLLGGQSLCSPPCLKRPFRGLQAGRTSQLPSSAHNSECVTRVPSKRNSCAGRRRGSMVVSACTMTPPPEGIPSPVAAPSSR